MTQWEQGEVLEITITDLSSDGEGLGRWQNRVVFVPDTVPGDQVKARLMVAGPSFGRGRLLRVLAPGATRQRPACIVADKCGGCQWQVLTYEAQLAAKEKKVKEAMIRLGGLESVPLDAIFPAPDPLHYRNKATYPLGLKADGTVKAGYYRKGTHRIVSLNQCPVQDQRLDPLLAGIKQDLQPQGWNIYDEKTHKGQLRHLSLRIGRRTGECLLTLVSTTTLPRLNEVAATWQTQYPNLVGVCLNVNDSQGNVIFGPQTLLAAGRPYLLEEFAGFQFRIYSTTFFQIHTEQAERLVGVILEYLNLQGHEWVVDAYCGIGTLTLPLAQRAGSCLGMESQPEAVRVAQENAALNGIDNVTFQVGAVEKLLPELVESKKKGPHPDVIVLDPPRKGCHPAVIDALLETLLPGRIVYMSCNPASLARDVKLLVRGGYRLVRLQPADFFPQTPHVECVAFLEYERPAGA